MGDNASSREIIGFLSLFFGLLAYLVAILAWRQNRRLNAFYKAFFKTQTTGNLDETFLALEQRIKNLETESLLNAETIKNLENGLGFAIQRVGLTRYSPFADGGGNYSFSLALLDARNSGIIITNMYGREHSRVYTKTLIQGKSETPLTEEEMRAVNLALDYLNQDQRKTKD